MANITQVEVDTTEHEYLNAVPEKPPIIPTKVPKANSRNIARIGSLLGLFIFLLGSIIPSK